MGKARRSARAYLNGYLLHGIDSEHYDQQKAKKGLVDRALVQGGDMGVADFIEYCETTGRKRQFDHLILSFDEIPDTEPGGQQVAAYALALAHYMHPTAPAYVVVHDDGKNHHVHAHLLMANNDDETGHALDTYHKIYDVRRANDRMAEMWNLDQKLKPYGKKNLASWKTRRERFASQDDSKSRFSLILGDRVNEALNDPRSTSMNGYRQALESRGITLTERQTKTQSTPGLVYHLKDDSGDKPRMRSRSASKLCAAFQLDAVRRTLSQNAEDRTATTQAPPLPTPQPQEPKSKSGDGNERLHVEMDETFIGNLCDAFKPVEDDAQGHRDWDSVRRNTASTCFDLEMFMGEARLRFHTAKEQQDRKEELIHHVAHQADLWGRWTQYNPFMHLLVSLIMRLLLLLAKRHKKSLGEQVFKLRGEMWDAEKLGKTLTTGKTEPETQLHEGQAPSAEVVQSLPDGTNKPKKGIDMSIFDWRASAGYVSERQSRAQEASKQPEESPSAGAYQK